MITIYTQPTCSKCHMLKKMMDKFDIKYVEYDDIKIIQGLGLHSVPYIDVYGTLLGYSEAYKWIKSQENN